VYVVNNFDKGGPSTRPGQERSKRPAKRSAAVAGGGGVHASPDSQALALAPFIPPKGSAWEGRDTGMMAGVGLGLLSFNATLT
jgi:hypothetical protein